MLAQGIFATPVQPARATGVLGFDAGLAATVLEVDTDAGYWRHAVPASSDFSSGGHAVLPRVVLSKGFSAGTIAVSYAKFLDSGLKTYGGSLDLPIIRGSAITPELAVRGSYAALSGADDLSLKTYGLEIFLSKGFGPVMPYAAIGKMRDDAKGTINAQTTLTDSSDITRYTAGLRISMLLAKIAIEATKAQVRSYAAKVSIGF